MKVKILLPGGYTDRHGKKYQQNTIEDMPDVLATKLARLRMVEIIRTQPVQRAVKAPAETAAKTKSAS